LPTHEECLECIPQLLPENQEAFKIWGIVSRQRIYVGMEGVSVDLNHSAVWKLIDEFEIEDRVECFYKVLAIFQITLELENLNRPKR